MVSLANCHKIELVLNSAEVFFAPHIPSRSQTSKVDPEEGKRAFVGVGLVEMEFAIMFRSPSSTMLGVVLGHGMVFLIRSTSTEGFASINGYAVSNGFAEGAAPLELFSELLMGVFVITRVIGA